MNISLENFNIQTNSKSKQSCCSMFPGVPNNDFFYSADPQAAGLLANVITFLLNEKKRID